MAYDPEKAREAYLQRRKQTDIRRGPAPKPPTSVVENNAVSPSRVARANTSRANARQNPTPYFEVTEKKLMSPSPRQKRRGQTTRPDIRLNPSFASQQPGVRAGQRKRPAQVDVPTTLANAAPQIVSATETSDDGASTEKYEQDQSGYVRLDLGNGMERLQLRPDAEQSSVMTTSGDIPRPAAESTENIRGTNVSYQRTPASNAFSPDVNYGAGPKYVNDPNQVDAAGGEPGHMYGHVKSPDQVQDGALYRLNTGAANRSAPVDSGAVGDAPDWFPTNVEVDSALGFTQEGLRAAGVKGVGKDVYSELTDRQNADSSTMNAQANMVNANNNVRATELQDIRAYNIQEPQWTKGPDGEARMTLFGSDGIPFQTDLVGFKTDETAPPGWEVETTEDGRTFLHNKFNNYTLDVDDQIRNQDLQYLQQAMQQGEAAETQALNEIYQKWSAGQEATNSKWSKMSEDERKELFGEFYGLGK